MAGLPWFRLYAEFLDDPKIFSLAFEDQRHYIAVLALKCRGVLDQKCDPKMLDRLVARSIWVEYSTIGEIKRRLFDANLIDEQWQPLSWEKRQFPSDNSTERTRKWRMNKKKTGCDVT